MATKGKSGAGPGWLDAAMALLAGGSVAFAIAAMPDYHFARMVTISGLPQILEAAQPPLGLTARLAAAGAAGAGAALLVWMLLRMLNRAAGGSGKRERKRAAELEEMDLAPPRLRRVDIHPDAPARRPLFAGTDLGEPEPDAPGADPAPEPWTFDAPEPAGETGEAAPAAWTESFPDAEPAAPEEAFEQAQAEPAGEVPQATAEPEAPVPESRSGPAPDGQPSLDDLVQRLERGARRRDGRPPAHDVNGRLRSALDDLQKMASRRG